MKKINIPPENFLIYSKAVIWGYKYSIKQIVATAEFLEIFLISTNKELLFYCIQYPFAVFECAATTSEYTFVNLKDVERPPIEKFSTTKGETIFKCIH